MKKDLKTGVVYGKLLLVNVSPILRKGATALGTIILSADSTCDLGDELQQRYHVNYYPFHVILEDKLYGDGIDLQPDDIYAAYRERGVLPKTAAISIGEYMDYFRQWTDQGFEVIHVCIGSGISATYNNCRLAAQELPGVYAIDSQNLSSGMGLVIIEAAKRIEAGMPAKQIVEEVEALRTHCHDSYVIDTLEFLYKGGRCSALAMFGANLLKLKPGIEVDNHSGAMSVGKKYRGSLDKALQDYVRDKLEGRTDLITDRIFITHSGISQERIDMVRDLIGQYQQFDEIDVTRASCTISSHCGPNTLGILFRTKE